LSQGRTCCNQKSKRKGDVQKRLLHSVFLQRQAKASAVD
jgi:hypothetical protein